MEPYDKPFWEKSNKGREREEKNPYIVDTCTVTLGPIYYSSHNLEYAKKFQLAPMVVFAPGSGTLDPPISHSSTQETIFWQLLSVQHVRT